MSSGSVFSSLCARQGPHEVARYGLRARRIGEASNPGPFSDAERANIVQVGHAARTAARTLLSLAQEQRRMESDDICRSIQRQKWSDLNCPLIWAAAGSCHSHAILDWLEAILVDSDPALPEGTARTGWLALRQCMRRWGVSSVEDLVEWAGSQGLGTVHAKQYIRKEVQEYIFNVAIRANGNVAALQAAYISATVKLSRLPGLAAEVLANLDMRRTGMANTSDDDAGAPPHESHAPRLQTHEASSSPAEREPQVDENGFVPVRSLADLQWCLRNTRGRGRAHRPADANQEMHTAGVGAHEPPDPPALTLQEAAEQPSRRRRRLGSTQCSFVRVGTAVSRRRRISMSVPDVPEELLPAEPPQEAWESLDSINLTEWFRKRIPLLKSCPQFLRGRYRHAQRLATEYIDNAENEDAARRGWKAFGLLSTMLLHRPQSKGFVGQEELHRRCELFARGDWIAMLESAEANISIVRKRTSRSPESERQAKREQACGKVRLEELHKARQTLSRASLAPGTTETYNSLCARQQTLTEDIPLEVLEFQPQELIDIDFKEFVRALKAAPRGSSGGPGGTTNEHLKIALDDEDSAALLHRCALRLAQARLPQDIADAFMSARMTALQKSNGKVRGIATGTAFRRLVAGCLARKIAPEVEQACAPYQYAMSTRAGTECIGHLFRAATDMDATATVLSIDGIGAFDHVKRAAMLRKLHELEGARAILPFVRLSYASPTRYVWTNDAGEDKFVDQGEGGEQGDPLMPLLFALGIHDALHEVAQRLRPGEDISAFLDDVYVLCSPDRVRDIYDMLSEALQRVAGIELHNGKTKVWNRAGREPPRLEGLGGEEGAWCPNGLILLGTPVGCDEFVKQQARERFNEELVLLTEIARAPRSPVRIPTPCEVRRASRELLDPDGAAEPSRRVRHTARRRSLEDGCKDSGLR